MEKLKASAKATASHTDWFNAATMVIDKQNKLAIIVSAFFSEKYFFIWYFYYFSLQIYQI